MPSFCPLSYAQKIANQVQPPFMRPVLILLLVVSCVAQEKRIKRADLPPPVEKTVATQSQGATIRGFSEEKERGQTYYEAEMTVNGHGRDVLMDPAGTIVEVEEEVSLQSLPEAVKDGLRAKAGAGKIIKVEAITKHDRLVAYEAKVITGEKRSEVQVGPDGKLLDHEE
jgi:hypothetical protein